MNQYIAACFVLPLLLIFIVQYGLQVQNNYHLTQFQSIVEAAKEEAKQEGYFSEKIIQQMKKNIKEVYKEIDESEIVVDVTTTPKYRVNRFDEKELIQYKIGIPIKRIMAANHLWGISDEENQMMYYVKGFVASERLLPEESR